MIKVTEQLKTNNMKLKGVLTQVIRGCFVSCALLRSESPLTRALASPDDFAC